MSTKGKAKGFWVLLPAVLAALLLFAAYMPRVNPVSAAAGDTENNPVIISSAAELKSLSDAVNAGLEPADKFYRLSADIDLSTYGSGRGWTPIGTAEHPFSGSFDGNGKKITGLRIDEELTVAGLFGFIGGGSVKRLGLEDVNLYGGGISGAVVGGIAGVVSAGSITNCYVTGKVTSEAGTAGGIAGLLGGNASVSNCYTTAEVTGISFAGGITGEMDGSPSVRVENCAALNIKIEAASSAGRIAGSAGSGPKFENNVAFEGTEVILNGLEKALIKGADKEDGADISTFTLYTSDGTIGGRFTAADGWSVAVTKLPGFGSTINFPRHLMPYAPTITTASLPDGKYGEPYSQTLAVDGQIPTDFRITDNQLPDGLEIDSAGKISGTPVKAGEFTFGVEVSATPILTNGKWLTIKILKADGAAAQKPSLAAKTGGSITLNAVHTPVNGQSVEYAVNTVNEAPVSGWQEGRVFSDLKAGEYFIFARAKENDNYAAGAASEALTVRVGLSAGAIAGIVSGSVVLAGAAGFCVYWFVFRKKKKNG